MRGGFTAPPTRVLFAPPPMTTSRRTPWAQVFLAALPAALHALFFLGRIHPDELFQSLEVATNRTWGFGVVPWEWHVPPNPELAPQPWGIRNWAVPLFLSGLFRFGDAVGITTVMGRRALAELPQYLLHAAMLGAVWRMAARRVNEKLALACLWLVALYGPLVWFAGRTLSESLSVSFLVWGLERLDAEDVKPWRWVWGGALLGFAQIARYGSAADILPAMVWLLFARRFKTFALATAGGLVVAVGLGLLDKLTWGEWFHSFIHYVRYNVTSGAAAQNFGTQPWWMYVPRLLIAPFAAVGLMARGARVDRFRRPAFWLFVGAAALATVFEVGVALAHFPAALGVAAPWLGLVALVALAWLLLPRDPAHPSIFLAAALGYLAIVSATAHKENRFLYPVLVILTVAGAPLFVAWAADAWKGARRAVAVAAVAAGLAFYVFPSPYDVQRKEQFQLVARNAEAITGLVIMNEGLWGSPSFFYLGRNIPWCPCDFPHDGCFQAAARDARFNRGLYWSNGDDPQRDAQSEAAFVAAGFRLAERRGQAAWFVR